MLKKLSIFLVLLMFAGVVLAQGGKDISARRLIVGRLLKQKGRTANVPSSAQIINAVGDTIFANATTIVLNPDANYVLTSTPTIANGMLGQVIYITCASGETKRVTVQDQDVLGSSNLQLNSPMRTIFSNSTLILEFNGTNWQEIGYKLDGSIREFNVKDFGAVGNGSDDDTAAIQAAIDTAEAAWSYFGEYQQLVGSTVYFPSGAYLVTGLTVNKHVNIIGAGKFATILYSVTNRPVIDIALPYIANNPNIKDNQMIVERLSLVGNIGPGSDSRRDNHGIRFTGDCVYISNVRCVKLGGHGLYLASGITSRVNNCTLTNQDAGYGLYAVSQAQRYHVSTAANGGIADGEAVTGLSSGATGWCKRYAPDTLSDTAGDIELYFITGTFTSGEIIEQDGDNSKTVTISTGYFYYDHRSTSLTVKDCTVRFNVKGIVIDGVRQSIVRDNLIESNVRGTGGTYGTDVRPGIALEFNNNHRSGSDGGHVAEGNYFEGNICNIYFKCAKNRASFNRHCTLKTSDLDGGRTTKSVNIWWTGARNSIYGEMLYSGAVDGIFYAGGVETFVSGCWYASQSDTVRRRIEIANIDGSSFMARIGTIVLDPTQDLLMADSRWPRINYGGGRNQMLSVEYTPLAVWNLAVNGGIIQYGEGYDAQTHRYASVVPSAGTWIKGDIIWNDDPDSGESEGWLCIESGTFEAIARTGDTVNGNDVVSDIDAWTGLSWGLYIDIAGVTGTFLVLDRDTDADTITLDNNADATLDDAAITNHDPVFKEFGFIEVIDISDMTNLAVTAPVILTDDTLSFQHISATTVTGTFTGFTAAETIDINITSVSSDNPVVRRVLVYVSNDPTGDENILCRLTFHKTDGFTATGEIIAYEFNLTYTETNGGITAGDGTDVVDDAGGLIIHDLVYFQGGTPEFQRLTAAPTATGITFADLADENHADDTGVVRVVVIPDMFQLIDSDASQEIHARLTTYSAPNAAMNVAISIDTQ